MSASKGLDRSSLEILIDHSGTDVRSAANGRRVSKQLGDAAAGCADRALRVCLRLGGTALGEGDRRQERAAPGSEVLRAEVLAHRLLDVVVEAARRQVEPGSVLLEPEEAAPARNGEQPPQRVRELVVDEHGPDADAVLRAKGERDPVPPDPDVALAESRDAVARRVAVVAGAEPGQVDQPDGDGARPRA